MSGDLIETVEYTDTETFGNRYLFQPVNIHTNRYFRPPAVSYPGQIYRQDAGQSWIHQGLLTQLQNESKVSREDVGMLSSNSLNQAFARLWDCRKVGDITDSPGGTGHGQDTVCVWGAIELFKAGYSWKRLPRWGTGLIQRWSSVISVDILPVKKPW
jgi:hypothetical protein